TVTVATARRSSRQAKSAGAAVRYAKVRTVRMGGIAWVDSRTVIPARLSAATRTSRPTTTRQGVEYAGMRMVAGIGRLSYGTGGRMASAGERTSVDVDGVRTTRTRGATATAIIAAGAGMVVMATAFLVRVLNLGSPPPVARLTPTGASERGVPVEVSPSEPARFQVAELGPDATIPKTRAGKIRALRAMGVEPTKGPNGKRDYSAKEIISALRAAGHQDGIAAFEPPGTDPPKLGLVVPDDFALPEGYIRYFQT